MNISVNVDCTPEEARRFMGLPDLAPIHDAYVERLRHMMAEGPNSETVAGFVRAWMPMGDAGITAWKTLVDQMQGAAKG